MLLKHRRSEFSRSGDIVRPGHGIAMWLSLAPCLCDSDRTPPWIGPIASFCAIITVPFTSIWSVVIYEVDKQPDARVVYARVFKYFVFGLSLVLLAASMFAHPILRVIAPAEYERAGRHCPDRLPGVSVLQCPRSFQCQHCWQVERWRCCLP
jgi:hypothetical protein